MTERPIIFSGPMVRALLEGRKTQTRRALYGKTGRMVPLASVKAGDRLYVREAMEIDPDGNLICSSDGHRVDCSRAPEDFICRQGRVPGMFMPRWASRLTLTVTEVRVDRLQFITCEDCVAEGHPRAADPFPERVHLDAARDWYMDLWDSLHPKQRWSTNPLVVALTFTVERACAAKA